MEPEVLLLLWLGMDFSSVNVPIIHGNFQHPAVRSSLAWLQKATATGMCGLAGGISAAFVLHRPGKISSVVCE